MTKLALYSTDSSYQTHILVKTGRKVIRVFCYQLK